MSGQRLKVTLVRSKQGRGRIQLACVNGLGLRRVNHSVELTDSAAIRGMINKVNYLGRGEDESNV